MKSWSLLAAVSAPMPFQMALDEILFRRMEEGALSSGERESRPLLRFYFSSEPWMTLGYSDSGPNGRAAGVPVCRRITGGGRVEHGKDLIFSLIALKRGDESFKSVRTSYLKIHEAVKEGFARLGKNVRFFRCDEKLARGPDCFLFPIATDLALGNEKIAGGAEKRSSGVLLHEESVKIPKGISAEELLRALKAGFEARFEIKLEPADWVPEWLEQAAALAKESRDEATIPSPSVSV